MTFVSAATPLNIAVVGAGPAGLGLALMVAQSLPGAQLTLFDARPADADVAADPRTLALSLGSVQLLRRLRAWPEAGVQAIRQVLVSQAPPTIDLPWARGEVLLRAEDEAVPMLGAVLSYGTLVARLQRAWVAAEAAAPQRLHSRFGSAVTALRTRGDAVEIDAGIHERFDLAVVAEGGVFGEQSRKSLSHDYRQTAWVGTVTLAGATPGLAIERFTRDGPLALLPLPPLSPPASTPAPGGDGAARAAPMSDSAARAALVWCVARDDDPVAALDEAQRVAVLGSLLPAAAGRVVALSPLKPFALGLNAERTLVDAASREDGVLTPGRIVRIGNAAQTLHPVAGQGLNLGLRDAMALVQALRGCTREALPAVLRRLEWSRAPDRWSMIAATDFLARSFTWRWPGLPAARGLALSALQAAAPLKSALARQMMFGRR